MLSVTLGAITSLVKSKLAGRDTSSWGPEKLLVEGIDRSGVTGWLFDVNNIVEKTSRGHLGVGAVLGQPPMSRYASRNVIGALLGPTAGTIQTISGVVGSAAEASLGEGEWLESDTHALRRLSPYQNVFYLAWMLDQVEKSSNDLLNVKDR